MGSASSISGAVAALEPAEIALLATLTERERSEVLAEGHARCAALELGDAETGAAMRSEVMAAVRARLHPDDCAPDDEDDGDGAPPASRPGLQRQLTAESLRHVGAEPPPRAPLLKREGSRAASFRELARASDEEAVRADGGDAAPAGDDADDSADDDDADADGNAAARDGAPATAATCERGHALVAGEERARCFYCDACGWRVLRYCHSRGLPTRAAMPVFRCAPCDFALCASCAGRPELEELDTRDGAARRLVVALAARAVSRVAATAAAGPADDARAEDGAVLCGVDGALGACVSGPAARGVVPQGKLYVCGAAATAGALNACREGAKGASGRRLAWRAVLFKQFRDKLGLDVVDADGDPASWKVGSSHIVRVLDGFRGVRCYDLVTKETAAPGEARAAAWAALMRALRAPRTAVLAHTRTSISGHYALVVGAVGPAALGARALGAEGVAYDPATCALLSNSISQEPLERISFERVCNSIAKAKMRFRLFAVEYDPAQDGRAKPPK